MIKPHCVLCDKKFVRYIKLKGKREPQPIPETLEESIIRFEQLGNFCKTCSTKCAENARISLKVQDVKMYKSYLAEAGYGDKKLDEREEVVLQLNNNEDEVAERENDEEPL